MTVRLPAGVDANAICLACHVLNFAAVTMKGDYRNVVRGSIIYMPNEYASDKFVLLWSENAISYFNHKIL